MRFLWFCTGVSLGLTLGGYLLNDRWWILGSALFILLVGWVGELHMALAKPR